MGNFKQENSQCTEYALDVGTCISWGLLSRKEASVAMTFISSGGKTPEGKVKEREYIVVISGSAIITRGNKKTTLMKGDCMVFQPGEPHQTRALEDVWIIAVTIPFSKDFPLSNKDFL